MPKRREIRLEILQLLKEAYPQDLSIGEVSKRIRVARSTASSWLRILKAERKIEVSRRVGNAIFYRFKRDK